MFRIAITDDHLMFRKSLAMLLNTFDGIEVVIEACNGKDLLLQLEHTQIDLVILDLQMPETDGFQTCKLLSQKYPDIKILILSQLDSFYTISKLIQIGIDGYFTKHQDPSELEYALSNIKKKGFHFDARLTEVLQKLKSKKIDILEQVCITKREMQIILFAIKEYSGKQIAHELNISLRTVEVHKKNIMVKTKTKNFIGAVVYLIIHDIVHTSDLH